MGMGEQAGVGDPGDARPVAVRAARASAAAVFSGHTEPFRRKLDQSVAKIIGGILIRDHWGCSADPCLSRFYPTYCHCPGVTCVFRRPISGRG